MLGAYFFSLKLRYEGDRLDRIVQAIPEAVVDIIAAVMENQCFKIDVSAEERLQCVQKVKERRMGYLFENMEKMSQQEERRKTEEQRKKTEEERKRADEAEEKLHLTEEKLRLAEEKLKLLSEKHQSKE